MSVRKSSLFLSEIDNIPSKNSRIQEIADC